MEKIKQQKQIKTFLKEQLNNEKAKQVFAYQSEMLEQMIANTKNKTDNQKKTLAQVILPRVALYQALNKTFGEKEKINIMRKYMCDVVGLQKHNSTMSMEKFPFFFELYRAIFLKIMRTTDLQVSTQAQGKGYYDVKITKCLWHTACVENGCPELCPLFCEVDDINYGNLNKMGFTRTKTIAAGADCCDFHFYKK